MCGQGNFGKCLRIPCWLYRCEWSTPLIPLVYRFTSNSSRVGVRGSISRVEFWILGMHYFIWRERLISLVKTFRACRRGTKVSLLKQGRVPSSGRGDECALCPRVYITTRWEGERRGRNDVWDGNNAKPINKTDFKKPKNDRRGE